MKKIALIIVSVLGMISCKNSNQSGVEDLNLEAEQREKIIDSLEKETEKQRVIDSMQAVNANKVQSTQKEVVVVNQAPAKKKWSGAAKGAVIGAGVGAVTGAIISDKKGEGAIIGGLAGAGVGAGTGAIIDESKKK